MSSEEHPGDSASAEALPPFRHRAQDRFRRPRRHRRPRKYLKKAEKKEYEPHIRAPLERQRALLAAALRLWELRHRVAAGLGEHG